MRFEAKHQYFKRLAISMGNYINLPLSLAQRHQCYQSYMLQDNDLLCTSVESGQGMKYRVYYIEYRITGIIVFE